MHRLPYSAAALLEYPMLRLHYPAENGYAKSAQNQVISRDTYARIRAANFHETIRLLQAADLFNTTRRKLEDSRNSSGNGDGRHDLGCGDQILPDLGANSLVRNDYGVSRSHTDIQGVSA